MARNLSAQEPRDSGLSAEQHRLIAEVCASYQTWAPEERVAPRAQKTLGQGLSNRVVLLQGQSACWVLRLGGSNPPNGICRAREESLHRAAAARGIAPQILWSQHSQGILVMEYLAGSHALSAPADIAKLLRKIHSLDPLGELPDYAKLLNDYRGSLSRNSPLAQLLDRYASHIERVCAALDSQGERPGVLCHNDLLEANRCQHAERLIAMDWEYASTGDAYFDLAVCASEMSGDEARQLLEHYLGRSAREAETALYAAYRLIYLCLEACWHAQFNANQAAADAFRRRLAVTLQTGNYP